MNRYQKQVAHLTRLSNQYRVNFEGFIEDIQFYQYEETEKTTLTIFFSKSFVMTVGKMAWIQVTCLGYPEMNAVLQPHVTKNGLPVLKIKYSYAGILPD